VSQEIVYIYTQNAQPPEIPMLLTFTCLDPRKTKKLQMQRMLETAGFVRFVSFAPLGFARYQETNGRAAKALETAIKKPRGAFMRWAKLSLLKRQYAGCRAYFERTPNTVAVAWNGLNGTRRVFMDAAKDAGNRTLFFELAPFADRITIDPKGVNFANSLPRETAPYIAWAASSGANLQSWHGLRDTITQRQPATPHAGADIAPRRNAPFIFVPLQVPGDSQLRLNGGAFKTVKQFVDTILDVAHNCPDGWQIRIKEHPSAEPFVKAAINASGASNVVLDNITDTFEQVKQSELVVTVNSSVGLEAMFFNKSVVACGDCFWAMEGIAASAKTPQDIADVLADPGTVTFNAQARQAFLSYLDQCYYPKLSVPEHAVITARIADPTKPDCGALTAEGTPFETLVEIIKPQSGFTGVKD
jgi:capsular polysaccharide export protein